MWSNAMRCQRFYTLSFYKWISITKPFIAFNANLAIIWYSRAHIIHLAHILAHFRSQFAVSFALCLANIWRSIDVRHRHRTLFQMYDVIFRNIFLLRFKRCGKSTSNSNESCQPNELLYWAIKTVNYLRNEEKMRERIQHTILWLAFFLAIYGFFTFKLHPHPLPWHVSSQWLLFKPHGNFWRWWRPFCMAFRLGKIGWLFKFQCRTLVRGTPVSWTYLDFSRMLRFFCCAQVMPLTLYNLKFLIGIKLIPYKITGMLEFFFKKNCWIFHGKIQRMKFYWLLRSETRLFCSHLISLANFKLHLDIKRDELQLQFENVAHRHFSVHILCLFVR